VPSFEHCYHVALLVFSFKKTQLIESLFIRHVFKVAIVGALLWILSSLNVLLSHIVQNVTQSAG